MTKRLSFWFDYSSPFAYLGATQVERLAQHHGAELSWRPFLLGGLFRSIGTANVPLLAMPEPKRRYMLKDMLRWARHYGVPFAFPSRFPMKTVNALRMTLQLPSEQRAPLAHRLFAAYWAEDCDLDDPEQLARLAESVGLDGAALMSGCAREDVKHALRRETEAAEALGVCGAPTFVVETGEGEPLLFWGQDRLLFVDKALGGWRPRAG